MKIFRLLLITFFISIPLSAMFQNPDLDPGTGTRERFRALPRRIITTHVASTGSTPEAERDTLNEYPADNPFAAALLGWGPFAGMITRMVEDTQPAAESEPEDENPDDEHSGMFTTCLPPGSFDWIKEFAAMLLDDDKE